MASRSMWGVYGLVLLLLAGCASAPKQARAQEPPWRPAAAMLIVYAAPDGSLTRVQMEAGLHRDFDKADANHDGCLNQAEVRVINQQRLKDDESAASPLIDFKNTGCLDFEEYAAAPRSLFDQLDVNGTGKLTAQQLKPGSKPAGQQDQSNDNTQGQGHHRRGGGNPTGTPN